jgi:hypothetical protein
LHHLSSFRDSITYICYIIRSVSQIFNIPRNQDSMSVQFHHCRLFIGFHRNILENGLAISEGLEPPDLFLTE